MKKIVILILIIFLTGCSKYVTCSIDIDNSSMNYTFSAKYKVYYDNKYVTKIVKDEKYTTENKDTYKYLKESKMLEYDMLSNSYGGYDYKLDTTKTGIKIKTTIDVNKLDVEKMVKDNRIDRYYTSRNKILLSGLKKYYESMSAICK